jgi:transcriptional regulator with XRE-family HTH domain
MAPREDPQVGLGRAIRKLRTEVELTQEALGLRSNVHPTWIARVEAGRTNPTWGSVRRIAAGLGVALAELAALAEEIERRRASKRAIEETEE